MVVDKLKEALDSYCTYRDQLQYFNSATAVLATFLAEEGLPSLLMEEGFYRGETNLIKAVLETIPNYRMDSGFQINIITVEGREVSLEGGFFQKSADYFAWQKWRLESMKNRSYSRETFPMYDDLHLQIESMAIVSIEANLKLELGNNYKLELDSVGDKEVEIISMIENPGSAEFKYQYGALITKPLSYEEYLQAFLEYNQLNCDDS